MDQEAVTSPRVLAARQALSLQELTIRKQELLSELQGYQVQRIPGTKQCIPGAQHCIPVTVHRTVHSIPRTVPAAQYRTAPCASDLEGTHYTISDTS